MLTKEKSLSRYSSKEMFSPGYKLCKSNDKHAALKQFETFTQKPTFENISYSLSNKSEDIEIFTKTLNASKSQMIIEHDDNFTGEIEIDTKEFDT